MNANVRTLGALGALDVFVPRAFDGRVELAHLAPEFALSRLESLHGERLQSLLLHELFELGDARLVRGETPVRVAVLRLARQRRRLLLRRAPGAPRFQRQRLLLNLPRRPGLGTRRTRGRLALPASSSRRPRGRSSPAAANAAPAAAAAARLESREFRLHFANSRAFRLEIGGSRFALSRGESTLHLVVFRRHLRVPIVERVREMIHRRGGVQHRSRRRRGVQIVRVAREGFLGDGLHLGPRRVDARDVTDFVDDVRLGPVVGTRGGGRRVRSRGGFRVRGCAVHDGLRRRVKLGYVGRPQIANRRRWIRRSRRSRSRPSLRLDRRRLGILPLGILRLSVFSRRRHARGASERLRLSFAFSHVFLIDRGRRGGEPRGEFRADSRRRRRRRRALRAARRLG